VDIQSTSAEQTITIRLATPNDRETIQQLRASVGWSTAETGLRAMAEGRANVYLLEVNGVPVASGVLGLQENDKELADGVAIAHISNLIVHPAYQDQGLGTKLLEFLESEARARGYQWITIGVDVPNTRARQLYERRGYRWFKDEQRIWGPVHYLRKRL
jgi:ribosomal protein S18 acetylase RimI-like enzyme